MEKNNFDIQDCFLNKMKADYEAGLIPNPVYKPYFTWKFYNADLTIFTPANLREMAETCTDEMEKLDEKHPEGYKLLIKNSTMEDIWQPYKGYGEDAYLFSYLSAIDSELTNLRLLIR